MGFRKEIEVLRESGGGYVRGVWQAGTVQAIPVFASVQPVTGKKLEALPENRRSSAVFALYSDFAFVAGGTPGVQGDKVSIFGTACECFAVEPWQNGVLNHFKGLFSAVQ